MEDNIGENTMDILDQILGKKPDPIDFLQIARDAYNGSDNWFDSNIRYPMERGLNQFYGRHDPSSRYASDTYKAKSRLFIPKTRTDIRKHEAALAAALFSTRDVVSVEAFDQSNKAEQAAACYFNEVINLRLTSSGPKSIPWMQFAIGGYQDAMNTGLAVARVVWDHKNDRPDPVLVDPSRIRFDPACNWTNPVATSPFIIEQMPMYVADIKAKIKKGEFNDVSDDVLNSARRPDLDIINLARNPGRIDPNDRTSSVKDYDLVMVHLNIINQGGEDYVFYSLSTDELLTDPAPIAEVFLHGERPYVIGKCVIETHKPYPSSLAAMTADLQRAINENANQRMDNVRLAMDKRYFVKRGANVDWDSLVKNYAGSVTQMNNPETDVKVVNTPDVNPSAYKEQSMYEIAFDDLVGGFNTGTMQSNRSLNETVGGMAMISQSANQVAEYQMMTYSQSFLEPVLRHILLLEKAYETDSDFIMLAGKNADLVKQFGQMEYAEIRDKDVLLEINIGMGSTNPATKVERMMMAIRSIQEAAPDVIQMLNKEELVKEIFGALGYKDGSRFIDFEAVDPEKEALKQMVQQLQQELQAKNPPEKVAAEVGLIKAQTFKTLNEGSYGAIQAAVEVSLAPACGNIADAIMKGNGYVPAPNGVDPNIANPTLGQHVTSLAQNDPEVLRQANLQANALRAPKNNDPLEPATGEKGFNAGALGGQE